MKTPITYYGGKQTMLKHIIPLIPEHKIYTEAFCGGAAVLFAKEPVDSEVINDLNGELVNFYRCATMRYDDLKLDINATLHSRDQHAHAAHIYSYPYFFNSVQRAWALWTLSKLSFSSKLDGTFGYDYHGSMAKKIDNGKDNITHFLCERLSRVTIENRDALHVIECYDSPQAFHFIDPPYVGSNCGHYADTFGPDDLDKLLVLLERLQGKFMLTMFPNPTIEKYATHNNWTIHKIERTISASRQSRRKQQEWIVCNYTL